MSFLVGLIEFNMELPYTLIFAIIAIGILILWFALVIWVWLDSARYFESTIFRFFFFFITLIFGFIGLTIYLLFRSGRFDQSDSDFILYDSIGSVMHSCFECGAVNFTGSHFCSKCGFRLQNKCKNCNHYVNVKDTFCSKCGALQRKAQGSKVKKDKVESFAQLGYIKGVFSKTSAFLKSFVKNRNSKNHKSKKH